MVPLGKSYALSPADRGPRLADVWPSLYLPSDPSRFLAAGRYKLQHLTWAKRLVAGLKDEAYHVLEHVPQVPFSVAGPRDRFYSSRTGEHLLFEPRRRHDYLAPSAGWRHSSEPARRAWSLLAHAHTARVIRGMAVLGEVTREKRYVGWGIMGMRLYHDYVSRALIDPPWVRDPFLPVYGAAEHDAEFLLIFANIYSLCRGNELIKPEDHRRWHRLATGLARSQVAVAHGVAEAPLMTHLHAATALTIAGRVFDHPEWTDLATSTWGGVGGLLNLLVGHNAAGETDGFCRFGSTFAHLQATTLLASLYLEENPDDPTWIYDFLRLFIAPVVLADRHGQLPVYGASGAPGVLQLADFQHLYEFAATQVDADVGGGLLAAILQGNPRGRGIWALLLGPNDLPDPVPLPLAKRDLDTENIVTLHVPDRPLQAWLRGGPPDLAIGHEDRLGLAISEGGGELSADLGEPGNVDDTCRSYFRSFLAHNTLFADDRAAEGPVDLLTHDALGETGNDRARTDNDDGALTVDRTEAACLAIATLLDPRSGVRFRRIVLLDPPFVVVVDDLDSPGERSLGWAFQARGALALLAPAALPPPENPWALPPGLTPWTPPPPSADDGLDDDSGDAARQRDPFAELDAIADPDLTKSRIIRRPLSSGGAGRPTGYESTVVEAPNDNRRTGRLPLHPGAGDGSGRGFEATVVETDDENNDDDDLDADDDHAPGGAATLNEFEDLEDAPFSSDDDSDDEVDADEHEDTTPLPPLDTANHRAPDPANPAPPPGLPPLPSDGPFAMLANRQSRGVATGDLIRARWEIGAATHLELLAYADAPLELTTAASPGNPLPVPHGSLVLRGFGSHLGIATVFEVHGGSSRLVGLLWDSETGRLELQLDSGAARSYQTNPHPPPPYSEV